MRVRLRLRMYVARFRTTQRAPCPALLVRLSPRVSARRLVCTQLRHVGVRARPRRLSAAAFVPSTMRSATVRTCHLSPARSHGLAPRTCFSRTLAQTSLLPRGAFSTSAAAAAAAAT